MEGHRALIMRDKYPPLACGKFENLVIGNPFETSVVGAFEIDRGLSPANAKDDCVIQVGIRKKSDAHYSGFRSSSQAR